ncbi:MAG: hypothetical protein AAGF04_01585 [Chlamydiota bacterium]
MSRLGNLSTIVDASVSGWRAVADYKNLGRYYADFTDFVRLHTPDPEGVAYSILQLGIAYFDAIDTAVSVGLIVQGIFDWEIPTQLLSHLILPLGGILLFLRSFLDIYSIWKGQKLLEEIDDIDTENVHACMSFVRSQMSVEDGHAVDVVQSPGILYTQRQRSIERASSFQIGNLFKNMNRMVDANPELELDQARALVLGTRDLIRRNIFFKTVQLAFSALAIIAFLFAFWQPIVLGLSLVSIALVGRGLVGFISYLVLHAGLNLPSLDPPPA